MRRLIAGLLVAGSLAILSGCGSSSNSKLSYSAFSNAANKICAKTNAQAKTAGGGAGATANAASAAAIAKIITIGNSAITKLKALSGPSALDSARDTFVADYNKNAGIAKQAEAAAKAGQQAAYVTAAKALAVGDNQSNTDGSKLGAPACATDS